MALDVRIPSPLPVKLYNFCTTFHKLELLNRCVREVVFCSSNMFDKKFDDIRCKLKNHSYQETYETALDMTLRTEAIWRAATSIDSAVNTIKRCRVGNCQTMALLAKSLFDSCLKTSIESAQIYEINPGNHAFLVINESWGLYALIWDPWADNIYPFYELEANLKDFLRVGKIGEERKPKTILRPFLPKQQKITPLLDPFCSPNIGVPVFGLNEDLDEEREKLAQEAAEIATALDLKSADQLIEECLKEIEDFNQAASSEAEEIEDLSQTVFANLTK